MDKLICQNCGHSFKVHEQSTIGLWFCDGVDEDGIFCSCNEFVQRRATGKDGDEIIVPYDDQSYRYN